MQREQGAQKRARELTPAAATQALDQLAGVEDEVIRAAAEHAAAVHGMKDTPELREQFRGMLKDEATLSHA